MYTLNLLMLELRSQILLLLLLYVVCGEFLNLVRFNLGASDCCSGVSRNLCLCGDGSEVDVCLPSRTSAFLF